MLDMRPSVNHKGQAFQWEDPFLLEDQLSEDERMVRDGAAAFCRDKLMQIGRAHV